MPVWKIIAPCARRCNSFNLHSEEWLLTWWTFSQNYILLILDEFPSKGDISNWTNLLTGISWYPRILHCCVCKHQPDITNRSSTDKLTRGKLWLSDLHVLSVYVCVLLLSLLRYVLVSSRSDNTDNSDRLGCSDLERIMLHAVWTRIRLETNYCLTTNVFCKETACDGD